MNFFFLLFKFLAFSLPKGLGDLLARGFARFSYTFIYRKGIKNHLSNLKEIFKDKTEKELLYISKKAGINLSLCLYEQLLMGGFLNKRNFRKFLKGENIYNLYKAFKERKGVVILTGHLGNYEWGAALMCYLGFPVAGISIEYRTELIKNIYEKNRKKVGMKVFYVKKSFANLVRFLKEGGVLALAGDRRFNGSPIKVKMFGKEIEIPKGAFFLASKLGSPIIPAFSVREKDKLYHVYFEEPYKIKEGEIEEGAKRYVEIFEKYIRKYPDQWFLFEKL
ncbi:MAG: lysophospholipid acyltransferase family protein [candidate division WOR-3 bacterium]